MKGIVFTEFIEMVEDTFSIDLAEQILEESDLPSGGVYTSLGTYDHAEMLEMVTHLSRATDIPVHDLVYAFGRHLFGRFTVGYPEMFSGVHDAFSLLERIDGYIHVEVRKLYTDAQLPRFEHDRSIPSRLVLNYRSQRPFAVLAHGLIAGCIEHYGEEIDVDFEDLSEGRGTAARFTLTKLS